MANIYWYGRAHESVAGDYSWDASKLQKNLNNAAAVDKGSCKVGLPCTAHGFQAGMSVTPAGTTNYDSTYTVDADTTVNEIVVTATYVAETFTGTETVTCNDGSNWKNCSDGSNANMPSTGDIVHFDTRAALNTSTGKRQSMNVNVTGTPQLAGVHVHPSFDGDIGPWSFEADDVIFEGSGTAWLHCSQGASSSSNVTRFVMNTVQGIAHLSGEENSASYVSLWAEVLNLQGTLYVEDDCALGSLQNIGANAVTYVGTGCDNQNSAESPAVFMINGTVHWQSPIRAGSRFAGGTFYWGTDGMTAQVGLDAGLIEIYPGARVYWQCADLAASILHQFKAYGGTLDASRSINAGYAKQIGSGSGEDSELWPGAKVKLDSGIANITLGAGSTIKNYGGTLIAPSGESVSW